MRKFLMVSILLLSQAGWAEKPWEKKPFEKWSSKEVNQILTDSPWAKTVHLTTANASPISEAATGTRRRSPAESLGLSEESVPRITYRVQLRSATPVRHAIARKSQLDANYDSMTPAQREALDAKLKQYLAQTFAQTIVVQVAYSSNSPTYLENVRRYWMAQTTEAVKTKFFLNAGDTKVEPAAFVANETVFQVTFPRLARIDADTKISIEFRSPASGLIDEQKVAVQFNAKDMTFDGAIAF